MMDDISIDREIPNSASVPFTVRAYETGAGDRSTLAALCDYMQEAAGENAETLGWGIRALQESGLTWMLARLRVRVARYALQGETLTVRTWPSGMKGKLLAKRCFAGFAADGSELFRAASEWLYVDLKSQKIARLPDSFAALVPPGTPDIELPDIGGRFTRIEAPDAKAQIFARRSDLDFNDHVNNVHYLEWMFETDPGAERPAELDIVFRAAAKAGDSLEAERRRNGDSAVYAVLRPADGAVLTTAAAVGMRTPPGLKGE